MSLVCKQSLLKVQDNVPLEQWQLLDRLTLPNPIDEILAYFDSKLLSELSFD